MSKRLSQALDLCLLNDDIPFDVLSRLRADKLVELRSVSKEWQNFIGSPDFRHFHSKTAEPVPISGYFFQERFEYTDLDVETLSYIPLGVQNTAIYQDVLAFLPEKVTILASNKGLICCRSCNPTLNPFIYICNPVSKEWIELEWGNFRRQDHIAFSFDPSSASSSSTINASRKYKLVKVSEINDFSEGKEELYFAFELYDCEREKWIKSKEVCHSEDSLCVNEKVLLNGVLYCLTDGHKVLTFDVENELSLLISLPLSFTDSNSPEICLGESDGVLNCIVVSEDALLVWALVDPFTSNWDLKSFVSFEAMEKENPEYLCNLAERVSRSNSENVPWLDLLAFKDGNLLLRVSNSVFSLDIKSMKTRSLCNIMDLGRHAILGPTVIPYSISLAPLANH